METRPSLKIRRFLFAVLAISFAVRGVLILEGGQYFWPDEHRYDRSRQAAEDLIEGKERAAVESLLDPRNPMFRVMGVVPALIEKATFPSLKIPAFFFSIFSVLNIWMVSRIVRSIGGREREQLLAAMLMALSTTAAYYARHILPYDTAMFFGLASLWFALKKPYQPRNALLSGFLACVTFLTYGGYWLLSGLSLVATILLSHNRSTALILRKLFLWSFAFALPAISMLLMGKFLVQKPLLDLYIDFAGSVTQGSFAEGWLLPFPYLWYSEHMLFIFFLASVVFTLANAKKNPRVQLGAIAITFIYLGLVVVSTGLQLFVVYGRLARQLMPFLVILGAVALEHLWSISNHAKRLAVLLVVGLAFQSAFNFGPIFGQEFPIEFRESVINYISNLSSDDYLLIYAEIIYPELDQIPITGDYHVVHQADHPLEFRPYQYEGYTPEQRALLRQEDIDMRLIIYENTEER